MNFTSLYVGIVIAILSFIILFLFKTNLKSNPVELDNSYFYQDLENQIILEETYLIRGSKRSVVSWTPQKKNMKAIVIISHGLYEHSLRYYSLASALTSNNYAVYAMDHYAHGKSDGQLGLLDDYSILHLDFIEFIKQIQLQNPGIPVFLFCHSMGTLVGLLAVSSLQNIHAVIFSGTALFIGPDSGSPFGLRFLYPLTLTDFAKILTKFLAELDPNGPAAPILDSGITSDEKELNLLKKDARQIHKWVVNKTAYEMLKMIEAAKKAVSLFNLPTLIIHGEKDEIALPVGSLFIYNNSKTLEADKRIKIFPGLKHEITHEKMPDQQQVLDTCVEFFDYYYSKLQLSP